MILTVLEAHVPGGKEENLKAAYAAGANNFPAGLVRSELLRDARDQTRWRIQTLWTSLEALSAMRKAGGTPAGVLMFRAAGAEPNLSVFEVVTSLVGTRP